MLRTNRDDRIDQVRNLTVASDRIQACATVEEMAAELCRHASRLVDAGLAIATVVPDGDWTAAYSPGWYIEGELAAETDQIVIDGTGLEREVCRHNRTVRMSTTDLAATAEGREAARGGPRRPALRGWLAAPLCTRDGRTIGLVQVSRRRSGEFTAMDEAVLEALAHTASVAIDKARVYAIAAVQEVARFREEILAGMSHDMQTPLAAIGGIIDILNAGVLDETERTSLHEALDRQHRNLRTLVQRFLDFSRLATSRELLVRPRPTDVVAVIEQAVELFEHQRDIILGVEAGLPAATADADRLQQVLVNLLSNAVKYSDAPVRVVARRVGDRVVIDVIDEGPGLGADDPDRLFEKFHRGANAAGTEGTGLGLYVSRALVEAQGGTLTASSVPGWGSRFQVELPMAAPTGGSS